MADEQEPETPEVIDVLVSKDLDEVQVDETQDRVGFPFGRFGTLSRADLCTRLEKIEFIQAELRRRKITLNPCHYGAPDLLFPQGFAPGTLDPKVLVLVREPLPEPETLEQYHERQNQAVLDFVITHLRLIKDDRLIPIVMIPQSAKVLADLFYGRVKRLILWASRGSGKCLQKGTLVLKANGQVVPVEAVRVGDRLMGPDGKGRQVLDTTTGRGPLYKIIPVKGDPWVCNEDHVLTLVKHGHQNGGGKVVDISILDWLKLSKSLKEAYKQFSVGVEDFEHDPSIAPLTIDPYFLGVWFGDGTKHVTTYADGSKNLHTVSITKPDKEIEDLCHQVAESWGLHVTTKINTSGCPSFAISTGPQGGRKNPLLEALRQLVGEEVNIPEAVLRGSRTTRLAFLAGFLDTDGYLGSNVFEVTQKRKDWADAIWWLARSVGLQATRRETTKSCQNGFTGTYHKISISGNLEQLPMRIPRKTPTPRAQRKDALRTGITVEPVGVGDYFGFSVDGDSRFLLGDFTVTHNSLIAAIYMWLAAVYRKQSCLNMGGAGEQARRIYDYTKQFWDGFPGMSTGMLAREPLLELTQLRNGTQIICATTKTRAIGEHAPIFVCDEVMSDRPGADEDITRAMQGPLSEPDSTIFFLSTFHRPVGLFASVWDTAEEMGFTRSTWDAFDTMMKCDVGLEKATPEDPRAIESFCKKECSLSWERDTFDAAGVVTGREWVGCLGKARSSAGWEPRERVIEKRQINKGTQVFEVEHANLRPRVSAKIFSEDVIESCIVPGFDLIADRRKFVGIDWGMTECAVVLIGEWAEETEEGVTEGIGVVDAVFMAGKTVRPVIDQIQKWQATYGDDIFVRADGSHPYNNKELAQEGYRIRAVHGDKEFLGQDNLGRWMAAGNFRILQHLNYLVQQFKNLKRSISGKQVKQNKPGVEGDHGPDAVKFAVLEWNYVKWFKKRQKEEATQAIVDTAQDIARQRRVRKLPMRGDFSGKLGFI